MDDIDQTTFQDDDEDWSKQWQPSGMLVSRIYNYK